MNRYELLIRVEAPGYEPVCYREVVEAADMIEAMDAVRADGIDVPEGMGSGATLVQMTVGLLPGLVVKRKRSYSTWRG